MNTSIEEFKNCPLCKQSWKTRDQFLADPKLIFNGYQASFEKTDEGLFYFTHYLKNCGSTMAIEAPQFYSLYSGKRYHKSKQNHEDCPGLCNDRNRLERCRVRCEHAFVREISQLIHDQNRKNRVKE